MIRRTSCVVFCILILGGASSFSTPINDCKTGSFHNCTSGVNNFPLPQGAWVDYYRTSCATSETNVHQRTTNNDTGCLQFWFECFEGGYTKTICNVCLYESIDATYLCNACL